MIQEPIRSGQFNIILMTVLREGIPRKSSARKNARLVKHHIAPGSTNNIDVTPEKRVALTLEEQEQQTLQYILCGSP